LHKINIFYKEIERAKPKLTIESIVCGNITAALRSRRFQQNRNKVTEVLQNLILKTNSYN